MFGDVVRSGAAERIENHAKLLNWHLTEKLKNKLNRTVEELARLQASVPRESSNHCVSSSIRSANGQAGPNSLRSTPAATPYQ